MMSPHALDDLLDDCHRGDQTEGAGPRGAMMEAHYGTDTTLTAVSIQEPITCGGCWEQVNDRFFLLAAGRVWHNACLRCSLCQCELQTHPSLFWRNGAIYCQRDYCRLFGGQCARCLQPIPASALVMRSGDLTFHQHCFSCQECEVQLVPGSLYCVQGQSVFCQSHCHSVPSVSEDSAYTGTLIPGETQACTEGEESESSADCRLVDGSAEGRSHRRTKRIRTCFHSEQLRALESYFAQKQNPDGKDWSSLSHRTGLPKRVLQVWFQNARAKLRRSLSSDDPQVSSAHLMPMSMATSPLAPPLSGFDRSPSPPFAASTIDQSQLSLITAPISPAHCLDYDAHDAPGSGLEMFGDLEETDFSQRGFF